MDPKNPPILKKFREREGEGNNTPSSLFHYFFNININFIIFFKNVFTKKCQKLSLIIPPSPTPWAKEEDS
jgi:hypothetical protein